MEGVHNRFERALQPLSAFTDRSDLKPHSCAMDIKYFDPVDLPTLLALTSTRQAVTPTARAQARLSARDKPASTNNGPDIQQQTVHARPCFWEGSSFNAGIAVTIDLRREV
jgi:hypothetical protein